MQMHSPPHPGEVLKDLYLTPLNLTITKVAEALHVPRTTISSLIHGRAPVTPPLAVKLSIAFSTTAEMWLNLQQQHDLWLALQNEELHKVEKLVAA